MTLAWPRVIGTRYVDPRVNIHAQGDQRMPDITLDQFESEAQSFLDSNASLKAEEKKFVWGEGSDKVTLFDEKTRTNEREELAKAQEWRQKKYDAGFGWLTGPSQYGGRELPQAYDRAWSALENKYAVPNQGFFGIGLGMVAPTILAHATDTAKDA
ncbi:MAG: hypothetical protein EHM63_04260, partial [Actinobacteria bacterium]